MNLWRKVCNSLLAAVCLLSLMSISAEAAPRNLLIMPLEKAFTLTDFEDDQDAEDVVKVLVSKLNIEFRNDGSYTMMEPVTYIDIMEMMDAQKLSNDVVYAAQAGKQFGARFVVNGRITEVRTQKSDNSSLLGRVLSGFEAPIKSTVTVELNFINCQKEIAVVSKKYTVKRSGKNPYVAFQNSCTAIAEEFVDDITNPLKNGTEKKAGVGRITNINGEILTLDQGANAKYLTGEFLSVVRDDKEIAQIEVLEIGQDETICRITSSKEQVKVGDIVSRD